MPTLVSIPYSPWSRRAAFALQRMDVPFTPRPYTTLISEPWLRWKLRRLRGPVTVPVLLREDGPPITDSLDIALWGARQSSRPLITDDNEAAVRAWSTRADKLMEAGRIRTTHRVQRDRAAMRQSLPGPLRRTGPLGQAIGQDAARRLIKKYGHLVQGDALAVMRDTLQATREALDGGETLLEHPSFADLAVACSLEFVKPSHDSPLEPDARRCWTETGLVEEYADIIAWRDRTLGQEAVP